MYTSENLSKKFKEAGFEKPSEMWWVKHEHDKEFNLSYWLCQKDFDNKKDEILFNMGISSYMDVEIETAIEFYPAYDILYDLSIKYAKEVFGEEIVCTYCGSIDREGEERKQGDCHEDAVGYESTTQFYYPEKVFNLLQQQKSQEEIEKYIITHSILFKV